MSGNIVNINKTENLYPRYRRAPTEPAIVIILPVIRIERPRRRLEDIVSPGTAARVRRELEKLNEVEYPSDTNPPASLKGPRPYSRATKKLPSVFITGPVTPRPKATLRDLTTPFTDPR